MIDKQEKVLEAYSKLAESKSMWKNRYDIGLLTSKMLCDYLLLSTISLQGKRVLNIGCSEPVDEWFFVDLIAEWHAVDINADAINVAKSLAQSSLPDNLYQRLKFIQADATSLLDFKDNYYDVAVAFSSLDHIPSKNGRFKAIQEMSRVLKPGGYLIITVPNRLDMIYSYRSNRLQKRGEAIFGYEHQFYPFELKRIIEANECRVIDCASTSFNPFSYFDRLLRKMHLHKVKIYFGTRFGYIAQKKQLGE